MQHWSLYQDCLYTHIYSSVLVITWTAFHNTKCKYQNIVILRSYAYISEVVSQKFFIHGSCRSHCDSSSSQCCLAFNTCHAFSPSGCHGSILSTRKEMPLLFPSFLGASDVLLSYMRGRTASSCCSFLCAHSCCCCRCCYCSAGRCYRAPQSSGWNKA